MATTYTTNYNLGKQENHADKFDMDVITDNADKIDAALTGLQSGIDGKQAALTTEQLAAVNSGVTSTDVAQIGLNKNNISYYQANGSYNKLRNSATTQTISGTTFTVNSDGTVDISGKPSSGNAQIVISDLSELENGKQYTFFNGGTVQESTNIYFGLLGASGVPNLIVPPNGVTITLDKTQYLSAIIRVTSSSPITAANFKPMATEGTITHSYEQYALSNAELTAKEQTNENNIYSNKDAGYLQSKNTVVYDLNSPAYITRSINTNGTLHVVADLTSSSQARSLTIASNIDTLKDGETYVLSGCVGGDYSNTYGFAITNSSYGGIVFQSDDPVEFVKTSDMKYLVLVVRVGQNWTKDFAPMICTKADYNRSSAYQPWIPSNRELYEMILAMQ